MMILLLRDGRVFCGEFGEIAVETVDRFFVGSFYNSERYGALRDVACISASCNTGLRSKSPGPPQGYVQRATPLAPDSLRLSA